MQNENRTERNAFPWPDSHENLPWTFENTAHISAAWTPTLCFLLSFIHPAFPTQTLSWHHPSCITIPVSSVPPSPAILYLGELRLGSEQESLQVNVLSISYLLIKLLC